VLVWTECGTGLRCLDRDNGELPGQNAVVRVPMSGNSLLERLGKLTPSVARGTPLPGRRMSWL